MAKKNNPNKPQTVTLEQSLKNQLEEEKRLVEEILELNIKNYKNKDQQAKALNKMAEASKDILSNYKIENVFSSQTLKYEQKKLRVLTELNNQAEKNNKLAKATLFVYSNISSIADKLKTKMQEVGSDMLNFLNTADKAIKNVNIGIGLVGGRANDFRLSMENAAGGAAQLGAGVEDLAQLQRAYNDELSSAGTITSKQLVGMVAIAKSTGMSMESTARMAGDYQKLGGNAEDFKNYVEDASNSSRSLGLNTGKVLANIEKNISKLNSFNFKAGRAGLKDMAQNAAKMNVSMESIFSSAEQAQNLEGSMEMAAKLNVLGGEFAKADPFKLLHESRNDMKAYDKSIDNMTKGMVTFNKETGKLGMSMADTQRMKLAAEALSIPFDELYKKASYNAKEQLSNIELKTKGFSPKDQEMITNLSEVNEKGKMEIKVGDTTKLLSELSEVDVFNLKSNKIRAEAMAKENQTFDEMFKNTIMELKSMALPLIKWLHDIFKSTNESGGIMEKLLVFGGIMVGLPLAIGAIISAPFFMLNATMLGLTTAISGLITATAASSTSSAASAMAGAIPMPGAVPTPGGAASGAIGGSASKVAGGAASTAGSAAASGASKASGFMSTFAGSALAVGGAVLMMGAGIAIAATGISYLADSFAKLNPEQIEGLKSVLLGLGVTLVGLGAILAVVGTIGASATPALLAFGGAILLIGGGIGLAALGMGAMADSMSSLIGKNAGAELSDIAGGILAINGALLAGTASIFGAIGFSSVISSLKGINDINFQGMTNAFGEANKFVTADLTALDKLSETFKAMENINMDAMNNVFQQMKEMMDKGMTVRFENDNVNLTVNTEIKIDSSVIAREVAKATVRIKVGK